MKLVVDSTQRHAKMRAHTATHLLHFALGELLGTTKQAGSLVDEDYLRFDFAAKQPLSSQDLQQIESKINHWIRHACSVQVDEMSYQEALATGAKAFFEDKYGDRVRVVRVIDDDITLQSIELCGGTHVANTSHIGGFLIISQEAVASGIRRISALTGPAVALHAQTLTNDLQHIADTLDCQPKQIYEKIDKLLKETEVLNKKYEQLQTHLLGQAFSELRTQTPTSSLPGFAFCINISLSPLQSYDFKALVTYAKTTRPHDSWVLYTNEGNYALSTHQAPQSAKAFAQAHGLKGGGGEDFVQGRDLKILDILKQ